MKKIFLQNKEKILLLFIFLFSFFINYFYANKGVSPHDSFSHFDTGFRILLGEYPFKDYWIISGPIIDYIQGFFFYIFGTNWNAYVLHASFLNCSITIATFFVLKNFDIGTLQSFLFSIFFSILAYTTSGTPFVDHHATFFSLLGIYCLMLAIKNDNNIYWICLPIFFILAFLSKQVPSAYIIILSILILILYSVFQKKFKWIIPSLVSSMSFIIIIFMIGSIHGIKFSSFYEQYISYPQTIGEERFSNYKFTLNSIFLHFKYIYLSLFLLSYIFIKKTIKTKNFIKKKDFLYFLILTLFTISLIFHQILTKNQTFIFFVIPIILAFCLRKNDFKKLISYSCIFFCLFVTLKYHLRFNEDRKFHDLSNSNFDLAINAEVIDKKLKGIKWITPGQFNNEPNKEIQFIKSTKDYLKKDERNYMVITNYSFFSSILEKKTYSPTRWHTGDGTDFPRLKNKYFQNYKNMIKNSIKDNQIEVIYIIYPIKTSSILNYINKNCFDIRNINEFLISLKIKKCNELL